jgi:DNA-binding protein YbaB
MGILGIPKAIQKANAAKKQMQSIQSLGQSGVVSILLNGINEIEEIEIESNMLIQGFGLNEDQAVRIAKRIAEDLKKSYADAKKQIEKKIVQNTSIDDLKELLG